MDIVIAQYKEDITWLDNLELCDKHTLYVYNKSENTELYYNPTKINTYALPNIGRVSHTFLNYIVSRYTSLPPKILFLQGNPFDHHIDKPRLQDLITKYESYPHITPVSNVIFQSDGKGLPHHPGLDIDGLYKRLFDSNITLEKYMFSPGAQYMISKDCILSKPINF
jgi:hypothetical protein